jgi:hypothetical protein
MPQPAAAPTQTPAAEQTPAQRQIERAKSLHREQVALQKRIDANRKYLRLMRDNEELNTDEAAWLDAFYAEKERGDHRSAEQIQNTKDVKESARTGKTVAEIRAAREAKAKQNGK